MRIEETSAGCLGPTFDGKMFTFYRFDMCGPKPRLLIGLQWPTDKCRQLTQMLSCPHRIAAVTMRPMSNESGHGTCSLLEYQCLIMFVFFCFCF